MSKTQYITRKVVESRIIKVMKIVGTNLEELDTITVSGRVKEVELAKKYGVDKVVTIEVAKNEVVYGVPVDKFMEIAMIMNDGNEIE